MAEQLIRARDRATKKVGEYTEGFLRAWPNGYQILGPVEPKPKSTAAPKGDGTKRAARPAATAPDSGADQKGGAS